jgi:hypothetical protein
MKGMKSMKDMKKGSSKKVLQKKFFKIVFKKSSSS